MKASIKLGTIAALTVGVLLGISPAYTAQAAVPCDSNLNYDTIVDIQDYQVLVANFLKLPIPNPKADIDKSGLVDIDDYRILVGAFLQVCSSSSSSSTASSTTTSTPPISTSADWTQEAHDAQRTGFTPQEPNDTWTFAWKWNASDNNGGSSTHFYSAPREAHTITGNGYLYAPAGSRGIYALNLTTGAQVWNFTTATINATPAYDPATDAVYAGGADGKLYKINSRNGNVITSYNAGNPINKSVLLVGSFAYVVTDNGQLHKVNVTNMTNSWTYNGNAVIATPPSYSATRDAVIYATNDLYVHAVNNSSGTQKWRVKPTPYDHSTNPTKAWETEMDGRWPVISEVGGVVFIRMSLPYPDKSLWSGPGSTNGRNKAGVFPNTNTEIKAWLQAHPDIKNLFALNLDNGAEKFIPAVGYTGVEDLYNFSTGKQDHTNGLAYLDIGAVPVVKRLSNGKEVAYIGFRNGQRINNDPNSQDDGRWDGWMGEMILDNSTISGYTAGDMRFIDKPEIRLIDEQLPLTMAGDTIFHAHWGSSQAAKITSRADNLGGTYTNPITTQVRPEVIRRTYPCSTLNITTHYKSCGANLFSDTRYYGAGFWVYWNTMDPPIPQTTAFQYGLTPLYTYASNGYVVVEGNGGDLFVIKTQ